MFQLAMNFNQESFFMTSVMFVSLDIRIFNVLQKSTIVRVTTKDMVFAIRALQSLKVQRHLDKEETTFI